MRRPRHPFPRPTCAPAGSVGCLALLLLASAPPAVAVGPGTLDPSFDGDGRLVVGIDLDGFWNSDQVHDVAVQADGRVVAVGSTQYAQTDFDFLVVRFDASGNLDPSFHADGIATVPFDRVPGNNDDEAWAVAIQPDGRIVVAGTVSVPGNVDGCAVARLLADGTLDSSFGVGGQVVVSFDGGLPWSHCYDVLVQPDGRIVLVGNAAAGGDFEFAAARLLADGTLDPSFDGDGKLVIPISAFKNTAFAVARQPDGKLVMAGYIDNAGVYEGVVVRISDTGALDGSFGIGGKVTLAVLNVTSTLINDIAIDSAGRLVLGGTVYEPQASEMMVARLTATGQLDASFHFDGLAFVNFGFPSNSIAGEALALLPDGRILLAGWSDVGDTAVGVDFAVAQLDTDGSLDSRFGSGGRAIVPFDIHQNGFDAAGAVVLRPGGRLLLAGVVEVVDASGAGFDLGFAQLYASVVFTDGFESGNLTAWSATVP